MQQIQVEGLTVEIIRKAIRRLYLRVHPPDGRVRVTAPYRASNDLIYRMVVSKKAWIERHQSILKACSQDPPNSIRFLGQRYLLNVIEHQGASSIALREEIINLYVPFNTSLPKQEQIIQDWYRKELQSLIPPLFSKWEPLMGVQASSWGIKKMKTRWGSCNVKTGRIWLNLELAKKPLHCLEYIIVHELAHLLEPSHNHRFKAFMDRFMPTWRLHQSELNHGCKS